MRPRRGTVALPTFDDLQNTLSDTRGTVADNRRFAEALVVRACAGDWASCRAAVSYLLELNVFHGSDKAEAFKVVEAARNGINTSHRSRETAIELVRAHASALISMNGSALKNIFDGVLCEATGVSVSGSGSGGVGGEAAPVVTFDEEPDEDDEDDEDEDEEEDDSIVVSDTFCEYESDVEEEEDEQDDDVKKDAERASAKTTTKKQKTEVCFPSAAAPTYGLHFTSFGWRGAFHFNATLDTLFYEAMDKVGFKPSAERVFQKLGTIPGLEIADVHTRMFQEHLDTDNTDPAKVKVGCTLVAFTQDYGWFTGRVTKVTPVKSSDRSACVSNGERDVWVPLRDASSPFYIL